MTREEYFKKQVEELVNNDILPILKEREKDMSQAEINLINNQAFFYSVDRVHPLQVIITLSRLLNDDEYNRIMGKFKERGYL